MEDTTNSGSPRGGELRRQWQQHLEAWRASGQTQVSYCRAHGLSRYAFHYWKQNLGEEGGNGFVELSRSVTPQPGSVVEILMEDPVRVRVPQGVSAEQLRAVLRVVQDL